jgi:hypothetical protein
LSLSGHHWRLTPRADRNWMHDPFDSETMALFEPTFKVADVTHEKSLVGLSPFGNLE